MVARRDICVRPWRQLRLKHDNNLIAEATISRRSILAINSTRRKWGTKFPVKRSSEESYQFHGSPTLNDIPRLY